MDNDFRPVNQEHPKPQPFKTPDQVASQDNQPSVSPLINNHAPNMDPVVTMSGSKKSKKKFWPKNKFAQVGIIVVVLLLIAGGVWYFALHKVTKLSTSGVTVYPKVSTTVASSLTGLQVSPATNKLPITAVMIENSTDARPQSGLSQAGVVFEALAEGGITRFVALYQSNSASVSVGPVRSARPYFISWLLGFNAAYAHVGGSPEALSDIKSWGVEDMDQFSNGSYYQRVTSKPAPHNVFTNMANLNKLETAKGYGTSKFTSWTRKAPKPLAKPTTTSISLSLASASYNVSYAYNGTSNTYNRSMGGTPEIDAGNNIQVSPNVVIAIVVPESNGPLDTLDAYYSEYQTVGSGTAYIYQDGGETTGQWSKSSNNAQILFTTTTGQTIPLNTGQVWITAVSSTSAVTSQ